jgi:hypothetical protein
MNLNTELAGKDAMVELSRPNIKDASQKKQQDRQTRECKRKAA